MTFRFLSRWAASGRYRLPMPVFRFLQEALQCRRNKAAAERACRLAAFLAQMHALTGRAFPLDRRKLAAAHPELGTVDQIRTAIEILEYIGFIDRAAKQGSAFRKLAGGGYMRAAVFWNFGTAVERVFSWCRKSPKGRLLDISLGKIRGSREKEEKQKPIFGGVRRRVPPPSLPSLPPIANPTLEAILAKLGKAIALDVAAA